MGDDEVLTVDDVADYLKLHKQTVSRMAQRGELPGVLIANRWRFKRSDVEAMLNTAKVDDSDNYQNHPGKEPMPLDNCQGIDAPSDLVGVTVISEEDGQASLLSKCQKTRVEATERKNTTPSIRR